MDRLEAEIKAHGMTVFARINHAALAAAGGADAAPTEVILFGNPRGGTPLMQANQTIGIDLPLKALVWQDASGKTWLSYNEPGLAGKAAWVDRSRARGRHDGQPSARLPPKLPSPPSPSHVPKAPSPHQDHTGTTRHLAVASP